MPFQVVHLGRWDLLRTHPSGPRETLWQEGCPAPPARAGQTHQLLAVLVPEALGNVQRRLPRLVGYGAG